MNTQNILRFYGSKLDLKLDSSEFYDYEISKVQGDYDTDVLDLTAPIVYSSLKIDNNLNNMDCSKERITLEEDNVIDLLSSYIYSGLTMTLPYNNFVTYFGTGFTHTILDSNRFKFTLFSGATHYFKILRYNETGYTSSVLTGYTESELISGFTSNVYTSRRNIITSLACSPQSPKTNAKPWAFKFDEGLGSDNCNFLLKRRTEKGWTLDFIFNRNNINWYSNNIFYYIGVRGDNEIKNYADNNLSFQFTSDRRIKWVSYRYSGVCDSTTGYSESYYLDQGTTPQLCTISATQDFNVTIVFDRYKRYTDCNLENDGGWNDLITGRTLNTSVYDWLTGATPNYTDSEVLNREWNKERERRLGILKIYLNGRPIYKLEDWEETIPSDRGVQPYIQSWGGGTGLMNNVHNGNSCFNIKKIKYYEEPLDFVHVRHNFITRLNNYNFEICGDDCVDNVTALVPPTPTPTRTPTPTPTVTPTRTPTPTPTPTPQ